MDTRWVRHVSGQISRFVQFCSLGANGCVEWHGSDSGKDGYGRFHSNGRMVGAHRWIYEFVYGPIQQGLEPDHICRNRRCVNINHLELVTHQENMRRSKALITKCPYGHEYTADNTIVEGTARRCRQCRRLHWVKMQRRKHEVQA